MPIKNYGVLKGRPVDRRLGAGPTPHYQILIADEDDLHRIAINVKSALAPSELKYALVDRFEHPLLAALAGLEPGFTPLASTGTTLALDYVRSSLFDPATMVILPPQVAGPDNDLNELIDAQVQRAMAIEDAQIYAFGAKWGPEQARDKYFGFKPGNGIHDIHMNQGSVGRFREDNGVFQDGGLLIEYPRERRWTALFLAFQSQSFVTDDVTGDARPGPTETEAPAVRLLAALVNPAADDVGKEMVLLHNQSPRALSLEGWQLEDRNRRRSTLRLSTLEAHGIARIPLGGDGAQLSNEGGTIALLDGTGRRVHAVSYTREQARREGWTIVF